MVKPNAMVLVLSYENQEVFKTASVTTINKSDPAQEAAGNCEHFRDMLL